MAVQSGKVREKSTAQREKRKAMRLGYVLAFPTGLPGEIEVVESSAHAPLLFERFIDAQVDISRRQSEDDWERYFVVECRRDEQPSTSH